MSMDTLPVSLQIVAKATQLSNIEVVPVIEEIKYKAMCVVLKVGDWRNRLINKAVERVNVDIELELLVNPEAKFYMYSMGEIKERKRYAILIMKYEIK